MDFAIPSELKDLQGRIREFIAREIIPLESDPRRTEHGPTEELRREMMAKARVVGLLAPHVAPAYGGLGLSHIGRAIAFEEAGYSLLGPLALNVFAPDEGNMHLLHAVAKPEHKERWLRPLAAGDIRSCFCMTEPPPGAGSDPSMLQTVARLDGHHYVINGRKCFISGAIGASVAIIMAKTEDGGATMFLADMTSPGLIVERAMRSLDTSFAGGHALVRFDDLRVSAEDILGAPGKGFQYAQVRLSPARLTHCMRWLGAVRRAHDVALDYARRRLAFGKLIGEHEGVGFMLADNEIDLHAARLAIWHCAWILDQGNLGLHESSRAKVFVSEALWRIVDRCVQILGGQGVTESEVARIFADLRAFRIYDGTSEVHRWSIAKRLLKGVPAADLERPAEVPNPDGAH
jgi:acyl-CoA dehydrogenase